MSPIWIFLYGLLLLGMFCWYFFTDIPRRKRWVGTALTVLLVAFCLEAVIPPKEKIQLGLDLQGGSSFLIRLVKENEEAQITPSMQEQAVAVIRKRIDAFGVGEPVITPQGEDRIMVQIPGLDSESIGTAREQLRRVAKLEFRLVHPESETLLSQINAGQAIIPPGFQVMDYEQENRGEVTKGQLLVKRQPDLTGDRVTGANAYFDTQGYGVALRFDSQGAELFGKLTAANVGNRFAILLDNEIQSAPVIQAAIYGGQAVITGSFSEVEARELASVLENPLATPVVIEEERNVSSSLGGDSIRSGVTAGLAGFGLTLIFVLIYYKAAGVVAIVGLLVNMLLLFGLMAMFGFVLTLPGIAGIILTIGMAIDANVLIFERIREETAAGKSISAAIQSGYDKAFSAIFDANITTLITSAILFWQSSGTVKGFAVTLMVGIIASMFSALLVTRNCFAWLIEANMVKRLSMMNVVLSKNFNFLGKRKIAAMLSGLALIASIGWVGFKGQDNLGIDFLGGDISYLYFEGEVDAGAMRAAVLEAGFSNVTIQRETMAEREFFSVRSPFDTGDAISASLIDSMPEAQFSLNALDKVGPLIGRELATQSIVAILLGLVGILIYVSLRFEFSFAVGALVALIHDIVIVVGLLAFMGKDFSLILVGAILTIAGYSINDTIVVFDRIREGLSLGRKGSVASIMNQSINDTLSRTVITGVTTLVAVLALVFYGGPVLHDFALAIVLGVIIGTYSSIFVAAPTVLWWSKIRGTTLRQEIKKTQEEQVTA